MISGFTPWTWQESQSCVASQNLQTYQERANFRMSPLWDTAKIFFWIIQKCLELLLNQMGPFSYMPTNRSSHSSWGARIQSKWESTFWSREKLLLSTTSSKWTRKNAPQWKSKTKKSLSNKHLSIIQKTLVTRAFRMLTPKKLVYMRDIRSKVKSKH